VVQVPLELAQQFCPTPIFNPSPPQVSVHDELQLQPTVTSEGQKVAISPVQFAAGVPHPCALARPSMNKNPTASRVIALAQAVFIVTP
jgi:hypothetical protein